MDQLGNWNQQVDIAKLSYDYFKDKSMRLDQLISLVCTGWKSQGFKIKNFSIFFKAPLTC